MEMQLNVLGAKSFNDTVDGTSYDNTKLFIMLPEKSVESAVRNVVGFNAIDIPFGTSAEYVKNNLANIKYPCKAICDIEITTKGMSCNSFKLLQADAK